MRKFLIAGLAALVMSAPVTATDKAETAPAAKQGHAHYGTAQGGMNMNWFDPSSWMANAPYGKPGQVMNINPMHPNTMLMFMRPQTHAQVHMSMMNPALWAQFMQPQMMMQMMHPNTFMAWMNPNVYASMMTPEVMNHMMNPASFMHVMDPNIYMQMMNPNAYAPFMNPALYMGWMNPANMAMPASAAGQGSAAVPANWFDPNAWMKMFQPQGAKDDAKTTTQ